MSLYGHSQLNEDLNGIDMDSVMEAYFYDDLSRMSDSALKAFIESDQCKVSFLYIIIH